MKKRLVFALLIAGSLLPVATRVHAQFLLAGWGTRGSATGQFISPWGVAVDASGSVYVADQGNNRIQKFTREGAFVTQFGAHGTANGQFNSPSGVAVDATGNIYVTDEYNHRIQKFDSAGQFVTKWGSLGFGNGQFYLPCGLALDDSANVYVADQGNYRIQKFTNSGAYVTQWVSDFSDPVGAAVDAGGHVYVVDYGNSVIESFTRDGTYLNTWGGDPASLLSSPRGVAADVHGKVYVTDSDNDRLQVFSGDGTFLTQWGTAGTGDGQFRFPSGVAVDADGNVYVTDGINDRVQKFMVLQRITAITDIGGDQGHQVRIRFLAHGWDFLGSSMPITGYYVYRRIDAAAAPEASLDRMAGGAAVAVPAGAQLDGWDYLTTVPATVENAYNVVVPTLADSGLSGTHWSVFMVRAATSTIGVYYDSAPDSGYSKDDLPPAVPSPFTAAFAVGVTHLHWGRNLEPDFWTYRLYRGAAPDFVPGPANMLAALSDTDYVDVGPPGACYKLSAADRSGNESGYARITPSEIAGVAEGGALAFALEGVRPNPVRGDRLSVEFVLPGPAPARLELLDVSGRRVFSCEVGTLGAGRHSVNLAADRRLATGLYLLRLTQGGDARTTRVAVIH
jgi:DNA-binding beta-propeller fold protein YncE